MNGSDDLWTAADESNPVTDLRSWAKMIAEKVPDGTPHKHGPFFYSQLKRAKETGESLICPGCGAAVKP